MNKQELIDKLIHDTSGKLDDMNYLVYFADAGFNVRLSEIKQRAIELGYKPADETPLDNGADWYCYETQKAVALPPVGSTVLVTGNGELTKVVVIGHDDDCAVLRLPDDSNRERFYKAAAMVYLRPLDCEAHKAEAEKKRVVDAAAKKFHASIMYDCSGRPILDGFSALYDAGYLRMPD
jgi:hypothetical protein